MPLKVIPLTEADALPSVHIGQRAWSPNPANKVLFPGPFPIGRSERRAEQRVRDMKEDPSTRLMKVVDTELGSSNAGGQEGVMIAFAQWLFYIDGTPEGGVLQQLLPILRRTKELFGLWIWPLFSLIYKAPVKPVVSSYGGNTEAYTVYSTGVESMRERIVGKKPYARELKCSIALYAELRKPKDVRLERNGDR